MSWLFIWILTILCLGMLFHGLLVRGRFYQYPFIAAGIFLTFILPQLPGLANSRFIPDASLSKTLAFSSICLAMCGIGWSVGLRTSPLKDHAFSEYRLLKAAGFLSLVGAYFFFEFGRLPDDERLRGILTGRAVAYLFFAKLLTYGFALALICYAHRRSLFALYIILFDSAFYLERIFIAGRRGETAEFCILIALAFWFQRRRAVPRTAVVAGLALSLIGLLGAEEYRKSTWYGETTSGWKAISNIDLQENWERLLKEGGPEMENALIAIEHVDQSQTFDFGLHHWNSTIFSYVPAQLVGANLKRALLINLPSIFGNHTPPTGSTATGMADAFASFWYFGAFKFFLIAFLLGGIYNSAINGSTTSQIIYMLSVVPAILVITHFTNEIVIAWIHMVIFLFPAIYYARISSKSDPYVEPSVPHYG
ncbi:hypothetical protein [Paramesorhizobium deserti]|nr:hypothetical protein [Paramesorhizobium deserti]